MMSLVLHYDVQMNRLLVTVDLVPSPKCAVWCQITKLLASLLYKFRYFRKFKSFLLTTGQGVYKYSPIIVAHLVGDVVPLSNFYFSPNLNKP